MTPMAYHKLFISIFHFQPDAYTSEQLDENGNCFVWSSNALVFSAWLPFNCSTKVAHPFIVCEKNLYINQTKQLYQRPNVQCTARFLEFNGHCIRMTKLMNNQEFRNLEQNMKSKLDDDDLFRLLTAWTMPLYTGQKRYAIKVWKWFEVNNCQCYSSVDTIYMENKTWSIDSNCNCSMRYPALIIFPQYEIVIPNHLFLCEYGNFIPAAYQCDGEADCYGNEDELNCYDRLCSINNNCTRDCLLTDCICTQLYHQCTFGGCVHQTFVCDGIVHCSADDSDELMCQYQLHRNTQSKRLLNDAFSLCNSYSNETYPNNEICLLTRDQYGVTEHCSNTEHLRYCVDFRCPNHYKCLESYCIPLHLVCDGIKDCPTGQDEDRCREFSCQGYFQCKGMHFCLHFNYLCDGVVDCPVYSDDEQHCDSYQCPVNCQCIGYTVTCTKVTLEILHYISKHTNRKAIILSSNRPIVQSANVYFSYFPWLLILNLAGTRFAQNLYPRTFTHMPQLRILDLTNIRISLDKGSSFRYMDSLKHLYLIRSEISTLYTKTFQLPNLMSLHLQYSGIHYIENCVFCFISNLQTLNLSFNIIKHISSFTFKNLNKLDILDISNNRLSTIEESALNGITAVWFSDHITKCCYLSSTSSCHVNHKASTKFEIQNVCQSILSHHKWIKVLYAFMGLSSTSLSIVFIIKILITQKKRNNKTSRFMITIAISDTLNGMYMLFAFISALLNEFLAKRIAYRKYLQDLLYYLAVFPTLSTTVTRLEHFLMTISMYMAICHVFHECEAYIRVIRLILWIVSVSYCAMDTVFLRHVVRTHSTIWQPYQMTDFSTKDMFSIILAICFELTTSAWNIFLCTRIYKSVKRNETRVTAKRIPKRYLVAKRLIYLTIGRVLITFSFISLIVLLKFDLGLIPLEKQVLIAIGVPLPTIVDFVIFYIYL